MTDDGEWINGEEGDNAKEQDREEAQIPIHSGEVVVEQSLQSELMNWIDWIPSVLSYSLTAADDDGWPLTRNCACVLWKTVFRELCAAAGSDN